MTYSHDCGRTTWQMFHAPQDAIYVWCNEYLGYPNRLALFIGRPDLRIVGPSFIYPDRHYYGYDLKDIVIDHAVYNKPESYYSRLHDELDCIADERAVNQLGLTTRWRTKPHPLTCCF